MTALVDVAEEFQELPADTGVGDEAEELEYLNELVDIWAQGDLIKALF